MTSPSPLQDGFARLSRQLASDASLREQFQQDPAGAFGSAVGWSADWIQHNGQPALSGIIVYKAGSHAGPFSEEAASRCLEEGLLSVQDPAWNPATRTWTTLGQLLSHPTASLPLPPVNEPASQNNSASEFLIYRNEQESIAYSPAEALAAISKGDLRPDDWAWNDSIKDWVPLRTLLPGLDPAEPIAQPEPQREAPQAAQDESRRLAVALAEDKELLEKKVSALEKHLAQALKACASLDRLKDELSAAQQQLRDRQQEAEARGREASSWQVKASEAEASLASLREEASQLRTRLGSAQKAAAESENRANELRKLQAELDKAHRDCAAARKLSEQAAAEGRRLEADGKRLTEDLRRATTELARAEAQLRESEIQRAKAQAVSESVTQASRLLAQAQSLLTGDSKAA